MGVLSLLFLIMASTVYAQGTIVPIWPKNNNPNHIASDEKEILERGDDLERVSKVRILLNS